jgi:hypothetical protein
MSHAPRPNNVSPTTSPENASGRDHATYLLDLEPSPETD